MIIVFNFCISNFAEPITIYKKSICGEGNCLCQLYGGEVTWSDGGDFKCENRTVCSVEMASEGFDCVCEEAEVCGENECLCQRYEEGDIWCEDVAMCKDEGLACKTGPDAGNYPHNLSLFTRIVFLTIY